MASCPSTDLTSSGIFSELLSLSVCICSGRDTPQYPTYAPLSRCGTYASSNEPCAHTDFCDFPAAIWQLVSSRYFAFSLVLQTKISIRIFDSDSDRPCTRLQMKYFLCKNITLDCVSLLALPEKGQEYSKDLWLDPASWRT